ncbi:MAG TPA: hypothetical protein VGJ44_25455 [Kribbellaceae bacterium]|jgi:hypothetical protein
MRRIRSLLAAFLLAIPAMGLGSLPAVAAVKTATIEFGSYPSIARADNGDTVELAGEGTFTLQPKSIDGDAPRIAAAFGVVPRTFTHRDAGGNVLAQGTWEPTAVLSYRSFGPATEEQSAEFGGLPPGTEGGKVTMKVALLVGGVHVANGIITIVCLLGVPPANSEEATLLLVQDTGLNFNQPLSSDNVFLRHVS